MVCVFTFESKIRYIKRAVRDRDFKIRYIKRAVRDRDFKIRYYKVANVRYFELLNNISCLCMKDL